MDPQSLDLLVWLLVAGIVLGGGFGHGVLGFGFPLMVTPLLAIMMDMRSAVLVTLLPTVAVNIVSIARGGNWSNSIGRYWLLAVMVPVGSLVGTLVLIRLDPAPFRLLLAATIVLHLVNNRLRGQVFSWIGSYPRASALFLGLAGGFLAGTVNVMVPLLILFAVETGMTPLVMVQVFNLCFLSGKLAQIGTFAVAGALTRNLVHVTLVLALLSVGGLLVGMGLRERVTASTYRRWLNWALAGMALVLVGQYVAGR